MTRDINNEYFDWLCSHINDSQLSNRPYFKLLLYLYNTEFVYVLPMDSNRYADGIDMRYAFGEDCNIEAPVIASCLDNKPCSILEMMVALANRCETHIMFNPENGKMPGRWFWRMIKNLGLESMYDDNFDGEYVNSIIWRFLNHEYESDGEGGLVYLPNSRFDLRSMEIWDQMMRYLSNYIRNGE